MVGKESRQERALSTIQAVTPLDHRRLYIEFGSGSVLELNMENRLRAARYYDLNSDTVFRSAVTDGEKIIFDTGSDFELEIFARETMGLAMKPPDGVKRILRVQPVENGRLRLEMGSGSILILNLGGRPRTVGLHSPDASEGLTPVSTDGDNLIFGDSGTISLEELTLLALTAPPAVGENARKRNREKPSDGG